VSTFAVKVARIRAIEPIENADVIELAVIGDYRSVVRKGDFRAGDLAVYVPEASLVPEWLLEKMGLTGKLTGKLKNRVKAMKLRGCLSQGLVYGLNQLDNDQCMMVYFNLTSEKLLTLRVHEGDDVIDFLGIVKYEPAIPAYMSGDVYNAGTDVTLNYDIDNFKAYPDVLAPGEEVVMTEKLHGTLCGVGILPTQDWDVKHYMGKYVVFSKGYGGKGLCFTGSERNLGNVYFRALINADMFNKLHELVEWYAAERKEILNHPIFVLGEVYGRGVQDLAYGNNEVSFRAFDVAEGHRNDLRYYGFDQFYSFCVDLIGVETVPVLYRGPFDKEKMIELTNGTETISGTAQHIREGIVIRPVVERYHNELGRVILKSVSEDYLLRKNGTEYN